MSKSMLPPFDTPNSCSECPLNSKYDYGRKKRCFITKGDTTKIQGIKRNCPLQDTTELLKDLESFGKFKYDFGFWNGINKMKSDYELLKAKLHKVLVGGK